MRRTPARTAPRDRDRADARAIIYELHVGGFTRHPSSGVAHPGKFAGLIEKIPYLKQPGVTHVELLPVMGCAASRRRARALQLLGLQHAQLLQPASPILHRFQSRSAGIPGARRRVAWRGHLRATRRRFKPYGGRRCFRARDQLQGSGTDIFYHLDADDRRRHRDYTGCCGNTVNCNHPLVTAFIVYCLG